MNAGRSINGWMLIAAILIAIIMVSGVIIWSKYSRSQPVDISIVPDQELQGEIYIGGEVRNPGFYPLKVGDSIEGMLGVAGGVTDDADTASLNLSYRVWQKNCLKKSISTRPKPGFWRHYLESAKSGQRLLLTTGNVTVCFAVLPTLLK